MNVMLTSVGRRAYMVKYFKEVLGNDGKVYVCNSDDKSIAFKYADEKVISPLIYDENYIPFLLDYCRKNEIDIVISLFDIDLLMLARHKKEFEKIRNKVLNELNTSYVDFEKNLEGYRKYIDKTLKLGDKIKTINVNYILNKISLNDMKEHLPEFTPQELDRIRCILGRLDFTSINEENYNAVKDFQEYIQMMIKNNIVSDKIQIYQLKLFDKMISRKFEKIHMN